MNRHTGQVSLSRNLRLLDITMIGIGGMICAGIFVLTGIAAGEAGPALVLAFLLNGIITTFTAMGYAELGSARPTAGGVFLWVKEGLGDAQGFLAGWMSWFAHTFAGTLYALGFGRFAAELWMMLGIPSFGLSELQLTPILMTLVALFILFINYRGTSETGKMGNIITAGQTAMLCVFIAAGVVAMLRIPHWPERFTQDFLPNSLGGLMVAMGLTFIAFEGYEIIAQSGEEAIDPRKNIPRAIFLSIAVAVIIYVLVAVVTIGGIITPEGIPSYQYLGIMREVAIIEAANQFLPYGNLLILLTGLVATLSALNATTYSSSRVSFAMGRERNLPASFSSIHPIRRTPHIAIAATGALMIMMGWILPIDEVGAGSSLMFLLLFTQVNLTVMVFRHRLPDLDRGYRVPLFPLIPVLGVLLQVALALYLITYSIQPWLIAIGWIVAGLLLYYTVFSKIEALERPKEILLEEVLVSRHYSVLVPVYSLQQARILGHIGSVLAQDNDDGEVLALHVVRVPPQLTLSDGRLFLKESRPLFDAVIEQAKHRDVPVHTMVRLGRNTAYAIERTALENASDLMLLGWPGYTRTSGRLFGSVIDPIVDNPPTDIALVRYRQHRTMRSILVPIAGGRNARLSVQLAVSMARQAEEGPARVTVLHILPPGARESAHVRAMQYINQSINGRACADYEHLERKIIRHEDIVQGVLEAAEGYDLIIVGATEEPLFKNLLIGSIAEQIARKAKVTVIMVKRRSSAIKSFLRQTVLSPSTSSLQEQSSTPKELPPPNEN